MSSWDWICIILFRQGLGSYQTTSAMTGCLGCHMSDPPHFTVKIKTSSKPKPRPQNRKKLTVHVESEKPEFKFFCFLTPHTFSPPGLSPDLQSMEQVRRVMRPTDVPDQGLLCDLLWADPDKDVLGWGENDRGVSFTFGADVVTKFLHKHDMDLICRAHQVSTRTSILGMLF